MPRDPLEAGWHGNMRPIRRKPARTPGKPRELFVLISPEDVLAHRALDCAHYDACLDVAAVAGWRSFSCIQCPISAGQLAPEVTGVGKPPLITRSLGWDPEAGDE